VDSGRQRTENDRRDIKTTLFYRKMHIRLLSALNQMYHGQNLHMSYVSYILRTKTAVKMCIGAACVAPIKKNTKPQCYNSKSTRLLKTNNYTCNTCHSVSFNVTNGARAMLSRHCIRLRYRFRFLCSSNTARLVSSARMLNVTRRHLQLIDRGHATTARRHVRRLTA